MKTVIPAIIIAIIIGAIALNYNLSKGPKVVSYSSATQGTEITNIDVEKAAMNELAKKLFEKAIVQAQVDFQIEENYRNQQRKENRHAEIMASHWAN